MLSLLLTEKSMHRFRITIHREQTDDVFWKEKQKEILEP